MRRAKHYSLLPLSIVAALTLVSAQENIDGIALLRKVSATYRSAKSFQVEGTSTVESQNAGMHFTMDFPFKGDFVAPTKMRIENQNSVAGVLIVSDGKTMWVYVPSTKTYGRVPLVNKAGSALRPEDDSREALVGAAGAAGTLFDIFQLAIAERVKKAEILREETLPQEGKEVPCLVVKVEYEWSNGEAKTTPQIKIYWIDKNRFVVLRETWEFHEHAASSNAAITTKTINNVTKIQLDGPVPPELFEFVPPAGAKEGEGLQIHPANAKSRH